VTRHGGIPWLAGAGGERRPLQHTRNTPNHNGGPQWALSRGRYGQLDIAGLGRRGPDRSGGRGFVPCPASLARPRDKVSHAAERRTSSRGGQRVISPSRAPHPAQASLEGGSRPVVLACHLGPGRAYSAARAGRYRTPSGQIWRRSPRSASRPAPRGVRWTFELPV